MLLCGIECEEALYCNIFCYTDMYTGVKDDTTFEIDIFPNMPQIDTG